MQMTRSTAEVSPASPDVDALVLGGYEVLEVLGTGGTSRVYRARHRESGQVVAIKILNIDNGDPSARGRFLREVRATSMIRHPNVVQVLDVGETPQGAPYMVMEMLDGEPLSMVLDRKGQLPWDEAKAYLIQICNALAASHEVGVIHRDLKLSNCLVVQENGRSVVKVLDFGLSRPSGATLSRLTAVGSVLGTPEYMSPEQARGEEVDHRTDIYAVGIIAYELLTGSPPYSDTNFMRLLEQHKTWPVPSPSRRNHTLTRGIDTLLFRALAKDRDKRIQSMADFVAEIEAADTRAYARAHYQTAVAGAVSIDEDRSTRTPDPRRSVSRDDAANSDEPPPELVQKVHAQRRRNGSVIVFAAVVAGLLVGGAVAFSFL